MSATPATTPSPSITPLTDTQRASWNTPAPTLSSQSTRVTCIPSTSEHFDEYIKCRNGLKIQMSTKDYHTLWSTRNYNDINQTGKNINYAWTIIESKNGNMIGHVAIKDMSLEHRCGEIATFVLWPEYQGHGYTRDIMYLVLSHVFDGMGMICVQWEADIGNKSSVETARHIGFHQDLIRRDVYINPKTREKMTAVFFSMLDTEWPTHRDQLLEKLKSTSSDTLTYKKEEKHQQVEHPLITQDDDTHAIPLTEDQLSSYWSIDTQPELKGTRVILRPIMNWSRDGEALHNIVKDHNNMWEHFIIQPVDNTKQALIDFHHNLLQYPESENKSTSVTVCGGIQTSKQLPGLAWSVHLTNGRLIGCFCFRDLQPDHRTIEIGPIWLIPDSAIRGRGIAAECMELLIQYAMGRMRAIRVFYKCDARNSQSYHLARSCYGKCEGTMRSHKILKDGCRRDSCYFAWYSSEWVDVSEDLRIKVTTQMMNEARTKQTTKQITS